MTKFTKEMFNYSNGYLTANGVFIARFKHDPSSKNSFMKFLIANFTVEEYFKAQETLAPFEILQAKGWKSNNQIKAEQRAR